VECGRDGRVGPFSAFPPFCAAEVSIFSFREVACCFSPLLSISEIFSGALAFVLPLGSTLGKINNVLPLFVIDFLALLFTSRSSRGGFLFSFAFFKSGTRFLPWKQKLQIPATITIVEILAKGGLSPGGIPKTVSLCFAGKPRPFNPFFIFVFPFFSQNWALWVRGGDS